MRYAVLFTVAFTAAPALGQTFIPLDDLPGGGTLSRGRSVSPDGVVVGVSAGPSGDEAVRWGDGDPNPFPLSDLPGGAFSSEALAAAIGGQAIFGWGTNSAGNAEAFRWTPAVGLRALGFLPSGGYSSRAYACSADGVIACGDTLFQPQGSPPPLPVTQAFRWTDAAGMEPLGFLPGGAQFLSTARAMSFDGSVIVGWATDSSFGNRPFRWTQATGMVDITGGQFTGTARGVSPDGRYIVGSISEISSAYLYDSNDPPGTYTLLPWLPGSASSVAADVSRAASFILGVSGGRACLWTTQPQGGYTVQDLNAFAPPGWNLTVAISMSDDGTRLTGHGTNPQGQTQGWLILMPSRLCPVDFNGDSDFGTDQDIEAFFRCLAGECCPTCFLGGSDINGDGDYGTVQDIESFFRCLAGACWC